jgi:membrane associated rhomboid family serine protease
MPSDPDSDLPGPVDEPLDAWDEPSPNRRIPLAHGGALLFEPDGFRLILPRKRSVLHPYESLTHVHAAGRMLLIGTKTGLLTIRSRDFPDPEEGPGEARALLLARLAGRPDGAHWIEQMQRLDRFAARRPWPLATWATVALCVLGTVAQLRDEMVEQVGAFVPDLFARGEYWRAVTTHFLHGLPAGPSSMPYLPGLPIHLAVNVGGLIVLGPLVERPLGSARTAIVLGLSGVGTIVGILFAGHLEVIGASGLVSGLAGAILALEFHFPETLPSHWRLPRRLFVIAVILQFFVIDRLLSDYVAGGAHLGGFVGGYLAAWWLGRPDLERAPASPRLRFATLSVVVVVVAGIVGAVPLARHDMGALERHAIRLLDSPESLHLFRHDNAAAWLIATEGGATPQDLTLAVALADRAVENTGRQLPGLLDTLAEALFQSGDRLGALVTIDEAIRLDPRERYFIEQRRRFTGERAENDRPPPPGSEPLRDEPFDPEPIDPEAPILTI